MTFLTQRGLLTSKPAKISVSWHLGYREVLDPLKAGPKLFTVNRKERGERGRKKKRGKAGRQEGKFRGEEGKFNENGGKIKGAEIREDRVEKLEIL